MTLTLNEIVQAVAAGLNEASRKPNVLNYVPNPGGQDKFHRSDAIGRLLAGSNRSGKSIAGVVESIWRLTGTHPFLETHEPPVFGRVITVDFDYGADQIIEPLLRQWIPPSQLVESSFDKSFNRKKHLLTLRNGSKLEIKAHGQDLESFAGTPRHFVWIDEECPKTIFIESKARLLDYNGVFYITMTPVEGLTWVFDDLIESEAKNVEVFEIDVRDNPHISDEAIETLASDLSEEDREIRIAGKFTPKGGLILKNFDYDRHVVDEGVPPKDWTIYVSIDAGFNNPAAHLWHAVSPDGTVVTFMEHYRSEWTIRMHCARILEINKELDRTPFIYIGDPSMSQRSPQTGHSMLVEYRLGGVAVAPGKKHIDNVHIDKMNEYFRIDKWYITRNCPNLIKEIRKWPWKTYQSGKIADLNNKREEPLAKDDHAVQSSGYFFRFIPDLSYERPSSGRPELPKRTRTASEPNKFPWRIDEQLFKPLETEVGFGEVL